MVKKDILDESVSMLFKLAYIISLLSLCDCNFFKVAKNKDKEPPYLEHNRDNEKRKKKLNTLFSLCAGFGLFLRLVNPFLYLLGAQLLENVCMSIIKLFKVN